MTDFTGPCFFVAIDTYVCMVFVKLLQIHTQLPVYIREVKDGLYTPSSYYLATSLVTCIQCTIYPFILMCLGFWLWNYTDDSFKNYFVWASVAVFGGAISGLLGMTLGALFHDSTIAAIVAQAYALCNVLGIGNIVNAMNANNFQKTLMYFSLSRWMYEIFLLRALSDRD